MVVHARDMLGFQDFEFALDGLIALESDWDGQASPCR